jgi:hypothetical protein
MRQPKPIKRQKTKEQRNEENRQRDLAVTAILPLLLDESKDVNDARRILRTITMMLTNSFQEELTKLQKEMSDKELVTLNFLKPEFKEYTTEKKILTNLSKEKIHVVSNLITNTSQLIESKILEENKGRELSELIGSIKDLK